MTFSVLPIDVGFDLRKHQHIIAVPEWATAIRYLDADDVVSEAQGTHEELTTTLREAGYPVEEPE